MARVDIRQYDASGMGSGDAAEYCDDDLDDCYANERVVILEQPQHTVFSII